MSPDPDKQTTVAVSYLLTEYVSIETIETAAIVI